MSSSSHSDLSPGVFVLNKKNNNWGIGQIQSSINGKITINFEHVGKKVINVNEISLKVIKI
jgi:Protein of unknown function (DUF3553).